MKKSSELTKTAPERIWLLVSDDETHRDEPFPYGADVSWSDDQALSCNVEYVRADVAATDIDTEVACAMVGEALHQYADALESGEIDGAGQYFPADIREQAEEILRTENNRRKTGGV